MRQTDRSGTQQPNFSGTVTTANQPTIDHDSLANFVSNEHIDWTNAGSNLSTTGTLTTGAITLPNTDGTAGQVLTTNGAGIVSFSTLNNSPFESAVTDTIIRESTNMNQYNRDFVVGSPQLADDGNVAHYNRMFFDKSKGAFRAGRASGTQWDDVNVGTNSIALGYNNQADRYGSVCIGDTNNVNQNYAIAIGTGNNFNGFYSLALGVQTTASAMLL